MAKLIPTMTSNYWPSPIKVWGNNNLSGQAAWNAFDGNLTTWYWAQSGVDNFLCVDMGEPVGVSGYTYTPNSDGSCPDNWIFKASNDWNGDWDTLDTQTNVTRVDGVEQTFNVSPTKKYRFYKWDAIRQGAGNYCAIPEVNLLSTEETLIEVDLHIGDKLIPTMTSNTAPSPFVASGSSDLSGQAPWNAFDGSLSKFYFGDDGADNFLKIDLGEAKRISGYVYGTRSSYDANTSTNWTLLGSNDDSTWDTIDVVSNFGKYVWDMEFPFIADSILAYRYYKLYPLGNGGSYCLVAGFNLLEYKELEQPTAKSRRFAQII